eukprot:6260333-Amphidinium_carterae.1
MEKQKLSNDRFNWKFLYFPVPQVLQERTGPLWKAAARLEVGLLLCLGLLVCAWPPKPLLNRVAHLSPANG